MEMGITFMNDQQDWKYGFRMLAEFWWFIWVSVLFATVAVVAGTYVSGLVAEQGSLLAWIVRVAVGLPIGFFGILAGLLINDRMARRGVKKKGAGNEEG